eukprot:gene15419-20801_t
MNGVLVIIVCRITSTDNLKLKYFDAKGAAEISRILLNVGQLPFEDVRYPISKSESGEFKIEEFKNDKSLGKFAVNMHRVPILEISSNNGNVVTIGQSKAIERYIAHKCNLMGNNDEEIALVDCIAENVRDIKDRWNKVRLTTGPNEKEAEIQKWFAKDGVFRGLCISLQDSVASISSEADSRYVINNQLSYADVCIWSLLHDTFEGDFAQQATKCYEEAPSCDRLIAIAKTVAKNELIQKYLLQRPPSSF